MAELKLMSLNGEDMIDLVPKDPAAPVGATANRGKALGALIRLVDPDVLGLVEAPPTADRTERFVDLYLDGDYEVHQGDKRGALGLALLTRKSLKIKAKVRTKAESTSDFPLNQYDADHDGIREVYNWANRVPLEVELSAGGLAAPLTVIVIHSKSKGAFIPGRPVRLRAALASEPNEAAGTGRRRAQAARRSDQPGGRRPGNRHG